MKLAFLAGALLLMTAGLYVYNIETPAIARYRRNAFHGLSQTRVQTLTYTHRMLIDSTQTAADGISNERVRVQTDSNTMIEPIYMAATRTYNIQLSFNDYNLQKLDLLQDNTLVNYVYNAQDEADMDIVFNAVMDATTGDLLSLNRVPGPEFEMIDTVAKDLLRQAFPSIRRQGFLLGQSDDEIEFGEEVVSMDVDLGVVDAEVNVTENDEFVVVETSYTDDDFV